MAKGRLSIDMGADEPEIDQDGILDLEAARHPLIDRKSCASQYRTGRRV